MNQPKTHPDIDTRLRFIDVETTGLGPSRHEIVDIAILDARGVVLLNTKVMPQYPQFIEAAAQAVNGFTVEAWEGAPDWLDIADEVLGHLDRSKFVAAGQNTGFDLGFVKAECARVRVHAGRLPYWHLDLKTLVHTAVHMGLMPPVSSGSLSLGPVCEVLGIEVKNAHTALGDVVATHAAWVELNKRLGAAVGA